MPKDSPGTPPPLYDQPLHNRFAEVSVPEAAALTDLTSGRMLLLRGGPGVSASGGGYGGTLSAERYFLVGLEEGYHLNVAEGVGEVSLKAKVIEVYLDGNHLCIDPIRSVQSTTSSTTIRLPVSIEGLRQEQIALVNSEHAIVWKDEFTRIWGDASAMKAGRDADTLAYMKLTRRIEHLPDALAAQAGKILETNPLRNPERLAEVLEGQEPLKRIDLMNLEAMRGRQIIRKAINKALVPGANRTELTLKETKAAGRAISDVFGLNFLGETGRGVQNNPEEIIRGVFNKLGELKALNLPKGEYAITSSGALAARGIRSAENIDIITSQHLWEQLAEKYPVVVNGDMQRIRIGKHIEILGPGSYYRNKDIVPVRTQLRQATTIQGFPFASLEHVAAVKRSTARSKDLQDLDLIQAYQAHSSAQVGHGIRTVSDRFLDGPRQIAVRSPVPGEAYSTRSTAGLAHNPNEPLHPLQDIDLSLPINYSGKARDHGKQLELGYYGKIEMPGKPEIEVVRGGQLALSLPLDYGLRFQKTEPTDIEAVFEVVFHSKGTELTAGDGVGVDVRGGTLHFQPFKGEALGTYSFHPEEESLLADALTGETPGRPRFLMRGDYVRDWLKANEVNEKHKPYKPGQRTTHLGDTGDPYTMLDLGTFARGEAKRDALRTELHMPLYEARATEGENESNAGIRQESLELTSETAQKRGEAMALRATKKRERDLKQGTGKRIVTPKLDPEISAVFQGSARAHQLTEEYNSLTSQLSALQASAPGVVSVSRKEAKERDLNVLEKDIQAVTRARQSEAQAAVFQFGETLKSQKSQELDSYVKKSLARLESKLKKEQAKEVKQVYDEYMRQTAKGEKQIAAKYLTQLKEKQSANQARWLNKEFSIKTLQIYNQDLIGKMQKLQKEEGTALFLENIRKFEYEEEAIGKRFASQFEESQKNVQSLIAQRTTEISKRQAPFLEAGSRVILDKHAQDLEAEIAELRKRPQPGTRPVISTTEPLDPTQSLSQTLHSIYLDENRRVAQELTELHGVFNLPEESRAVQVGSRNRKSKSPGTWAVSELPGIPDPAHVPPLENKGYRMVRDKQLVWGNKVDYVVPEVKPVLASVFQPSTQDLRPESYYDEIINESEEQLRVAVDNIKARYQQLFASDSDSLGKQSRVEKEIEYVRNQSRISLRRKIADLKQADREFIARQTLGEGYVKAPISVKQKIQEVTERSKQRLADRIDPVLDEHFKVQDLTERLEEVQRELHGVRSVSSLPTVKVGGREVKIAGLRDAGTFDNQGSYAAQNPDRLTVLGRPQTVLGRPQDLVRGQDPTHAYIAEQVTSGEVINRLVNPEKKIEDLEGKYIKPEDFFKKYATSTDEGIKWDSRLYKPTLEAPKLSERISLPARAVPGARGAGVISVDRSFYTSLFEVPAPHRLSKEEALLRTTDESLRKRIQEEGVSELQQMNYAMSQGLLMVPKGHALYDLQSAMAKIPELHRLMLRGGKDTIGEDGTLIKRAGAYERGSFERYILSLIHTPNRKERAKNVDYQAGLRNILRLNREVSQKYLGGAVVDPIQLLGKARLLAPTATAELRTLTDGLDLEETPLLSEVISFSQGNLEKIGSNAINDLDVGRKMVEQFVSKKGWRVRAPHEGGSSGTRQVGEAQQAASDAALREEIERNKTQSLHIVNTDDDKEFTFADIGEGTPVGNAAQTIIDPEAQAIENIMQEAAEKAATAPRETGIRNFLSVRDFFGQLSGYQGQDPKERHSSVNRALETLENPDEDYRRGSFFGFSFDPEKGLSSVRTLTSEQYARRAETNRIAPTRMHFEFVQSLNPHEQKALASRVGYQAQDIGDPRKNRNHWLPIDDSIPAPAGYHKFLEQGIEQGWLTEKEAEETRLSEAQFHILQQIFQTPIMDTLLLDRNPEADLPSWHKRVDRFLKRPEKGFPEPLSVADRRRFVPEDPHNKGDITDSLSQSLDEDGLDRVLGGEKIQKERLAKMTETMQGEKAWEFAGTPGIERNRIIENKKEAPIRVGVTDSEEGEYFNGTFYPHVSTPVIAAAEGLAKGYKEESWSSAWQRPISDERVPLRQIASGDNRAFISPERAGTSEHETLQRFLDSMENGAHVVGFDIESDPLDFVKDKDGNFALDKKGKRIATKDSRYQLTNVGSQGFLIGPGGEKIKEETAFDMASESFIKRKGLQNAVPPTSAFGVTDEEHMVSSAYEHLSSYNKDTFFAVFNTAYDAPRMVGYAQKAIDSHTSLLESALSKEEEDNARLRVEHFQAAKDFFDVEMPSRMFDAEHVLQLAGARPGKSQLVDYLRGAGVLGPYEEQIHGSSRDVGDMMQGVFTALKAFLQGPAKVQDLDKQYFFPLQVTDREQAIGEDGNIKRKRLKSPFLMEGVTQTDGEHGPVFTLYGRSIDKDGTPIGPLEPKIVRTGAGQFQRTLSQDFGDGQTFLTADKEGLAEAWKKSLDPENLRDLVERDVRRAQIFNDKSSPNEALREEFKARADIVQKYEALDSEVDKQNYITTVVKNLTEQSYRTIDTKDAQDIYPFLNAKSAGRIHDWLNSGTRDNAGNEGFAIPHTREVDRQVGRIIKERETSGRDMLFDQLLYPAVLDGTLSPEESQKTSQAFQSLADTLYMTGQRETGRKEGLVISLKSLRNGRASLTSLSGQPTLTEIQAMSPEEREGRGISSDLYKEILRKPKRISDVPGMNQEDVYNALFTHGLAVSYKAQKMIADTEEKEMSPSFHQNLDSQIITDLMRDLRSSAPELEELGILQTHQSLHSLAEDIRQTLATSTRQRTVPDDMETGPRRDESGNPATWGSYKEKFQPFTSVTLPEEDKIEEWLADKEKPRQLAFDLINKSQENSGKFTTPALARTLPPLTPQGVQPEVADALRETLRQRNEPPIPNTESVRFARDPNAEAHSEDVASGAARLVRDVLSEQAEHAVHDAEESLGKTFAQEGLKGVANSRIGLGIGALLGLAALSDIGSRVMDSEDKRDGLLPGSGNGDTSHNAGKLDTEINQSGNNANTQAAEGWKKLHVNIDIMHNGFPGSSARLSSEALNAFSQDVGKVLTSHFNSTPQYSQSESKSQNNEPLRFRIGNTLNRAFGRYGSN